MSDTLIYVICALLLAIGVWLLFLTLKYQKLLKKARILFSEEKTENLGKVIENYLNEVKETQAYCYKLDRELKRIAKTANSSMHKIGFLRYNPFGDIGSNQSFSLCLLDSENNGFVITSIHSREGTRVYSKAVKKGVSEFNLSKEEEKAIEIAKK